MINRQENENSFNNDDEAIQDTEIHPVVDPFQTSAEHYRILAENVSDTVWLMDMNLKVTYISPSVTRLRGFTLEELNRIPFDQQMTPESFLRAITLLQETLTPENLSQTDKKITASIELEFYKKDGSSFWSENKFVLLRDEQGKPVHILSSGRDITERKRAMEALRYSEYRYRTLIDQAANALFVHDLDGKIVEVNQRACESLGYTQDELLSMTVMDFEQDFDLASARIVWDKIEPGQPSSVSGHHRRKDGSFFPVEIHFACLDIHGQRLIMGLVTDISERKEAEETIRYHANLIEQITDAIVSTDLDECIMSWNHGAEKIYGWRAEEVRGKILNDVVKTDFLSFTRSQVLQTVLKKGSWSGEVIQCERDGRTITVQATLSAITAENLKPNGIVAVFRDITEYKRTEEALQFSEARYKSLFLNMLEGFAYCKMIYEDGRPVDFIYLNVNPAFEKLTNLSNVVGKPVSEVIPGIKEANPELLEIYGRVASTGNPEKFETYLPTLDYWLWISVYCPAPGYFVAVFDNITARKRIEEQIRQSEERLSLVMRSAQIGTWDWNIQSGELLWSTQCLALFGLSLDEIITYQRFLSAVHPDDRDRIDYVIQQAIRQITDYDEEIRSNWPDGSTHWITIRGRVFKDDSGQAVRMIGAAMDITERRQNEEAMRQKDELLRLTGEMAHIGGWEFDADTLEGVWTDEVARIHDLDPLQPTNVELGLSFYINESRQKIERAIQAAIASGIPYDLELEMVTANGNHKWIRTIGTPIKQGSKITKVKGIFQDITSRIQAEVALRESEEHYRHLFFNAQVGLFRANPPDGKMITCNSYFAQRVGYMTTNRCATEYIFQEITPGRKQSSHVLKKLVKDGRINDYEMQISTRYGSPIWVNFSGRYFAREDFIEGAIIDITDRKQAEEALLQSEERFSKAFRANPASVIITRISDGKIIDVNDSYLQVMGYTRAELIGQINFDLENITKDDDRVEIKRIFNAQGYVRNYDMVLQTKEGCLRNFLLSLEKITIIDEPCWLSVFYDITERKQAEQEIQRMNAELEETVRKRTAELSDLYNNAPVGYHSLDANGLYLRINDTELKWLGYSREEIIGKVKILDLLSPASVPNFYKFWPHFKKQGWIQDLEVEMVRKDGTILPVLLSASAIYDNDGQFLLSRSTIMDHTVYKNTEAALRESQEKLEIINEELEAFSFSVSHDLRAPLRRIDGWSLAFLEDYGAQMDETAQKYLTRMRAETQHMDFLIDDLLLLSRVTRAEMKHDPVDLTAIAQTINQRLQEAHPDRRVEILIQPDMTTRGDPALLGILLTNLFDNAWKYSGTRPVAHIEFGIKNIENQPTYFVRDNGVGYDMTYAEKLFGVFQRLHDPSEFPGVGIGLATVQRIVHRHGGRVWSEAQIDQGATFYFTLGDAA